MSYEPGGNNHFGKMHFQLRTFFNITRKNAALPAGFFWRKTNSGNFFYCSCQVAGGSWWPVGGRWQVTGGMWPNCLGDVRKAGIRCGVAAGSGGKISDIGGGVLSTFYVTVLGLSAPSEEKSGIIKYNGDLENFSNKRERNGKY